MSISDSHLRTSLYSIQGHYFVEWIRQEEIDPDGLLGIVSSEKKKKLNQAKEPKLLGNNRNKYATMNR